MYENDSTTPIIRWAAPPPSRRGQATSERWARIAEALRSRPGEWAVVGEGFNTSVATSITRGKLSAFRPAGAFEATTRGADAKGHCTIYARYLGGEQ